jgi:hypothetical protein
VRSVIRLAVLIGLIAGVVYFLPLGGRTMVDRWRSSRDAADFAARAWAELRGAPAPRPSVPPVPPAAPRTGKPGKPGTGAAAEPAPDQPLETTTDADRKALDKLLDRHLADEPRR